MRLQNLATNKDAWALAALMLLIVLLPVGIVRSQASFVAASPNPGSVFSSASSFNTVVVSLTDPGTPLRGNVTLNAVATSDRGISNVVFETSPAGANTWTTACSDNNSPYSCTWNTAAVADGLRDVRVTATDASGFSRTATVTNRRVDNTAPTATTTDPGSPKTGTVTVSGTGVDGGSGVASTKVQYSVAGAGAWVDICSQAGATATCSWNTAALSDGLYDLRTVATDVAGNTGTSAVVANRRLDNLAPSATLTAPAANLTDTITLASTTTDSAGGSGVASVRYEYKPSSGSTWTTACTGASSPFSCSFDTTTATDGLYDFRAVATDGVGLSGTSAAVTSRRIDTTAPTATMGALAANLSGSVSLTSTLADSGVGVASAQYQYKLASDSTWTNACSSSTTPYSCSFNSASVTDGLYDFRVVATDSLGNAGASTAVFSRRIDNTDPSVTMGSLAAKLTGSISLTSTPSDGGGSGVASVQYEYKPSSGSTWTPACSSASTPYSCSFNTAFVTDGDYDFRAVATDNIGRTGTSAVVGSHRIDNTDPTVTMTAPAANLGGTVTLSSTAADAGSGVASVQYQYKLSSDSTWSDACWSSSSPFSCWFDTSALADGLYDFRAVATDQVARTATSAAVTSRRVDNTAPVSVTLGALPTSIRGTVNMTGTATETGSGIASVRFQYTPTGTTAWTDACTDTSFPYTCSFDSTTAPDGGYELRALATDNAGNTQASTVQTRTVDNTGPAMMLTNPAAGAYVRGTIDVTATATDATGVTSIAVQYRLDGAGTWTTLCTDSTAPYSCALNTAPLTSGSPYEIRLAGTDTLGNTSTSTPVKVTVDNVAPTAVDIQALNGGTANTMDAGDTLTFTYSEQILTSSLLSGWDGSATAVTVRVTNSGANDTLEVYDGANTTRVGLTAAAMALNRDVVSSNAIFSATLQQNGSSVVVTLGALTSGTVKSGVKKGRIVWAPSTAATDLAGNAASATSVTEGGTNDRDF
jgi:chemotaxis methyl-accepting protein methylase